MHPTPLHPPPTYRPAVISSSLFCLSFALYLSTPRDPSPCQCEGVISMLLLLVWVRLSSQVFIGIGWHRMMSVV